MEQSSIDLGEFNLTVNYQIDLGDLLVSCLLVGILTFMFIKWMVALLFGGKNDVVR
jgi:hypothetical protein